MLHRTNVTENTGGIRSDLLMISYNNTIRCCIEVLVGSQQISQEIFSGIGKMNYSGYVSGKVDLWFRMYSRTSSC